MIKLCTLLFFALLSSSLAGSPLQQRAEAGDAESQVNLGLAYRDGTGVPQDEALAVEWFRKSAEQGHPRGQDNLGYMLLQGRGVERNGRGDWVRDPGSSHDQAQEAPIGFTHQHVSDHA